MAEREALVKTNHPLLSNCIILSRLVLGHPLISRIPNVCILSFLSVEEGVSGT